MIGEKPEPVFNCPGTFSATFCTRLELMAANSKSHGFCKAEFLEPRGGAEFLSKFEPKASGACLSPGETVNRESLQTAQRSCVVKLESRAYMFPTAQSAAHKVKTGPSGAVSELARCCQVLMS